MQSSIGIILSVVHVNSKLIQTTNTKSVIVICVIQRWFVYETNDLAEEGYSMNQTAKQLNQLNRKAQTM